MCLYYISASKHQIFESHLRTSYNIPLIIRDSHKNFEDPMLRSWDIALSNIQSGHFHWDTLHKSSKVVRYKLHILQMENVPILYFIPVWDEVQYT